MAQYTQAQLQHDFLVHSPVKGSSKLNSDEEIAESAWSEIQKHLNIEYNANFFNADSVLLDTTVLLYCILHGSPNIVIVHNEFNRYPESQLIVVARKVARVQTSASVETLQLDESDVPDIVRQCLSIEKHQSIAVSVHAVEAIVKLWRRNKPSDSCGRCLIISGVILMLIPVPIFCFIGLCFVCAGIARQ